MNSSELPEGLWLVAACADVHGTGGLYGFNGSTLERIDGINCNSVTLAGSRLLRLLWSIPGEDAHLLVYNERGLERHHVLSQLGDAHHVAYDGAEYIVVSTATNSIVWLSPSGEVREWRAPGAGDAWHLNGTFVRDGSTYACAFGRSPDHEGWRAHARNGSGVVFDIDTGKDVLSGLCCPHHPVWLNGSWVVCNSATHEVLDMDEQGKVQHRVHLGGWTRGVAICGDRLFVGVSAPRRDPDNKNSNASIAIISLRGWELLDCVPVPSLEIGGLAIVPAGLVDAVRRAVPAVAKLELQMLPLGPLDNGSFSLEATDVPPAVTAGSEFHCRMRLENRSPNLLRSSLPNPVFLSYHWADPATRDAVVFDGMRTPLRPPAASGSTSFHTVQVQAPSAAGTYLLQLTLVQESVRWFDEAPTCLRSEMPVTVSQ